MRARCRLFGLGGVNPFDLSLRICYFGGEVSVKACRTAEIGFRQEESPSFMRRADYTLPTCQQPSIVLSTSVCTVCASTAEQLKQPVPDLGSGRPAQTQAELVKVRSKQCCSSEFETIIVRLIENMERETRIELASNSLEGCW